MPTEPNQLLPVNDREVKLATIIKSLNDRERAAYRYFVRANQEPIHEDKAEEMFKLYRRGESCEEIRRLFQVFGLGQIVAARVVFEWDSRLQCERESQKVDIPARIESTQLDMQEFLSTLLAASNARFMDSMKLYIATRDKKYLDGIPTPKSAKELATLMETYMKVAGLDTKKVDVSVHGTVAHTAQPKLKQEEAEAYMDELLQEEGVIDVESKPVEQPPVGALPPIAAPVSRGQLIQNLMSAKGMTEAQAEEVMETLDRDVDQLAKKYMDRAEEIVEGGEDDDGDKGSVN
jgi:hypothetical protein